MRIWSVVGALLVLGTLETCGSGGSSADSGAAASGSGGSAATGGSGGAGGSASGGDDGGAGASPTDAASDAPTVRTAPTQTTYATSGGAIHMPCQGSGALAVVLVAGGSDPGSIWDGLVTALGPQVLTCRFDRPGVAPSYKPATPLTPQVVATALAETLAQADLGPRVLLVGHSLGGPTLRVFGAANAGRIAGAIFLDPTPPSFAKGKAAKEVASLGWDPAATADEADAVTAWSSTAGVTVLSHDPALLVPAVLTAQEQTAWEAGQKAYAQLTTAGSQQNVPNADHYVFVSAKDTVVKAILDALLTAK